MERYGTTCKRTFRTLHPDVVLIQTLVLLASTSDIAYTQETQLDRKRLESVVSGIPESCTNGIRCLAANSEQCLDSNDEHYC